MNIKICGLRTKSAVDEAVKNGATHLGFILSKSHRQVTPEAVSTLTENLPKSVKKVGVFVNESIEFVKNAVAIAGLDLVQLHGDEDMDYIRQMSVPVIKAVSDFAKIAQYENIMLLLDSPKGGSGQTFDWTSVRADSLSLPFFVAGGLTPDNVAAAVQHFQDFPHFYGVDVSSGVETDGVKDLTKICTFIQNASLAHYDDLLTAFLTLTQRLNAHGIIPYLMGSVAVQLVAGFSTNPDDIDIQLRQSDFAQFDRLSVLMEDLGYHLIDWHEHKFEKGNIHVGFANVETLKNYANVDFTALSKSELGEFYLPNLQQNIKIYEAATRDNWRNDKYKDKVILEKLKELENDR
ncbi:N-(5'-phosphoribosyl)anthranilate isomerase [Lactococcus allomyrinae]|uniref:N-(5'-phosphoribosyl)anthranilate isomerase n=1 Tax=Lactococcus allomyrinae TaxID=2419773 RepID=A0A387BGE4_9LACT|nr:phosphoribosylanthranilate isomerase [Lactococcus allomyrinae]AYG00077.1 N-(5'-phosphoribosyl)anthranilate isomerase [Lactococcus allomyrinae]